jgi:hypothetical protein
LTKIFDYTVSVRPGKYDRKHYFLIKGAELRELKQLDLAESFGLDRRIERYQGKRPLGLYRWDLEGLLDALSLALDQPDDYYSPPANKQAIKKLHDRLQAEYKSAYGKNGLGVA